LLVVEVKFTLKISFKVFKSRMSVAHANIPSYSGGRDQEDCGSASPGK
jgi:hypothetical protein